VDPGEQPVRENENGNVGSVHCIGAMMQVEQRAAEIVMRPPMAPRDAGYDGALMQWLWSADEGANAGSRTARGAPARA
jgi:hypothetical protein